MSISRISIKYDNQQGTIATVHSRENLSIQSKVKPFHEYVEYLLSVCLIWCVGVFGVTMSISRINFKYDQSI